jgi:Core-2/I-Branching enzyme
VDLDAVFPHKYLLNLARRQDRRERCEELFAAQGWSVRRHPAVDSRRLSWAHGFETPGKYAHALSTRMIVRRAMLAKAEAVLILEDDVVLHPFLAERLAEIELPDDWGIFYLGCQHHQRPEVVAPGLVRVAAPLDTHAWGVRAKYFWELRRALRGKFWPRADRTPASDLLLAELTRRVPAYAAWPNLAWQQEEISDITGGVCGNYDPDGTQYHSGGCLRGLLAECLGGQPHLPAVQAAQQARGWFWPTEVKHQPPPVGTRELPAGPLTDGDRIAFLFLTRGAHCFPGVWEEYWRGEEPRVSVYGHAGERGWPATADGRDRPGEAQIADRAPAHCGNTSLVREQMALLKEALRLPENRFFVFASESCLPVRPFSDLRQLLAIDGRSRFVVQTFDEVSEANPDKADRAPFGGRIPRGQWRFHSPWIHFNREAAELLAANERLIDCFEGTRAADESAFGTILHIAGYPLGSKLAAQDLTWSRRSSPDAPNPDTFGEITPELIGDIAASGCYFARGFAAGCPIGEFGLHRP